MKTTLLLLLTLLIPAFAGCTGNGAPFNVDAPQWAAGYAFAYRIDGHYSYDAKQDGNRDQESGEIGPDVQVIEVLNTTLLGGKEPAYLVAVGRGELDDPQSRGLHVQLSGVRKDDLAFIRLRVDAASNCNEGTCINTIQGVAPLAAPDDVYLDFPLTRGKTWAGIAGDYDGEGFGDEMTGLEFVTTARAVGRRAIDTPTGRINAIQVDVTTTPTNTDEFLSNVRKQLEAEGGRLDSIGLDASTRTRLWYSPDHLVVVKSETVSTQSAHARGRNEDGKKFDFSFTGNSRINQALTGAKLVPRAERDLAYAARLLFGQTPLLDPSGLSPVPIDYSLDLTASKTRVNAADAENVSFDAKILGVDRLPDGHKISWRIRNLEGNVTAEGAGTNFTVPFREPGEYAVEIEARDAKGNITASDGLSLVADYIRTLRVDCPDVGFSGVAGHCPKQPLPVRVGIQRLTITAKPIGTLPTTPLTSRVLELLDANGRRVARDTSPSSNTYSIEIQNLADRAIDGRDYTMQLLLDRAFLEDAEYSISLLYGSDPHRAPVEAPKPRPATAAQLLHAALDDA